MRERYGFAEGLCRTAEAFSRRTLALPFHARLEEDDQAYVAECLRDALAK
jgi:dTDP-4-amino-4,6-dideoxygalactose transaminase